MLKDPGTGRAFYVPGSEHCGESLGEAPLGPNSEGKLFYLQSGIPYRETLHHLA